MSAGDAREMLGVVWRRLQVVGWLASAVGVAVAFLAIGFIAPIFGFTEAERNEFAGDNLPLIPVGFVLIGVGLNFVFGRMRAAAFGWIDEGRDPTPAEHEAALRWPERASLLPLVGWTLGAIVGAVWNLGNDFDFALIVLVVFAMAGEATSSLTYLLSERVMRPITAYALHAREPRKSIALGLRKRLLFTWSLGTGVPIIGLLVVGIVGVTADDPQISTGDVAAACVFFATVAMAVGLYATMIVSRAIADPVTAMRAALERVARGDLETRVAINDATEIGLLQAGFNRMADGLRERERIRDLFGRHVGRDVAQEALDGGVRFSGEEREIGALFVDLTGSTSMAVAMPPTEVVRLLNRFFRVVVDVTEREGGLVNKFEGDGALCVFGAPVASQDPAGAALRAARALCETLEREVPEVGFGVGVSAGTAVAGNVGAEHRFEYTVIGDPVNEAARLCDLAKERELRVLASDAAFSRAATDEREEWMVGEQTVLRGRLDATGLATPRS